MSKAKNIIQGFLVGATAGVLTGVLVAPDRGKRTRRRLKISFDRMSKRIVDKFDEQAEELKEQVKKEAKEAAKETVKEAAKEAANKTNGSVTSRSSGTKTRNASSGKVAK